MVTFVFGIGDLLVLDDHRGGEETEHDQDGNDRVGPLKRKVVLALLGDVVALAAIAKTTAHTIKTVVMPPTIMAPTVNPCHR